MLVVFIIDDATINAHRQRDRETPGGIAPIPEMSIMGQALNCGLILLVHSYSTISEIIRQNTETFIILGLPGENTYTLRNCLDFTIEQAEKAKTLNRGQAVIINPVIWPKPVLINITKPDIPETCSENLRRQAVQAFMANVTTMPPVEFAPEPDSNIPSVDAATQIDITTRQSDFLIAAGFVPPWPISRLYRRLKLSNTEGRRTVKRLQDIGLIALHPIPTGRPGGKIQLPQLTEEGWKYLLQHGHHRPKNNVQGSWLHNAASEWIEAECKAHRCQVYFEVDLGCLRADVQQIDSKTNCQTFYNIGLSNPEYEAQAIIKFFSLPVAKTANFVLVTHKKAFANSVNKCLKNDPNGTNLVKKYTVRLIGSFIQTHS